jgi:hypothetical protein
MTFLNSIGNANTLQGGSSLNQAVTNANNLAPPIGGPYNSSASPNALPSSQIPSQQLGRLTRNIMHWFVPQVGVVSMYINPQKVEYAMKKIINKQLTKGGFIVQYWGEELQTIKLTGHTGSSGIEGLNVLEEIYRSEQLLFDPIAQSLATSNAAYGIGALVGGQIGNITNLGASVANVVGALDPSTQNIAPNNIPSLASMAFAIELYYTGLVYRGYFESFSYSESVSSLGFFDYSIAFVVTQTRGYRTNSFAWQRSADSGPSNNGIGGVPLSFAGLE